MAVLYAYVQYPDKRLEKFSADEVVNTVEDLQWIRSMLDTSAATVPERILISIQ